jgi:predicted NBD/HSP70 family sugar kinase
MTRNAQRVLDLLGQATAGLTRAEIGAGTGLSKPTIQSIVADLRSAGRITEVEPHAAARNGVGPAGGRPPERFVLTPDAGLVAGIDIGHGHVRVAIADRSCREVGKIQEDETIDVDGRGVTALERVVELISEALESGKVDASALRALTIGIPAAIDKRGTVLFSDALPSWATVDIGDELLKLLDKQFADIRLKRNMIRVENDANLGALGECLHGRAKDVKHYLYVKVSTGIGMGLVLRGQLYRGAEGAAGEFGHVTVSPMARPFIRSWLPEPATVCPRCSKLDCLENVASGQAILRQLGLEATRGTSDGRIEEVIELATGNAIENKEELQAIVDAGRHIGFTLADVVRVYAPEVVIIGGLMAKAGDTMLSPIKDAIAGMKSLSAVKVHAVEPGRIKRSEVDGAVSMAAALASRVSSR